MAGGEPRGLEEERARNTELVLRIRVIAVALWSLVLSLNYRRLGVARLMVPELLGYLAVAVVVFLVARRSEWVRRRSSYLLAFADIPALYLVLRAAVASLRAGGPVPPAALAAFSLLPFVGCVVIAQLTLARRYVFVTAASASVFGTLLMRDGGWPSWRTAAGPMFAVVLVALALVESHVVSRMLRRLAELGEHVVDLERRQREVGSLNEELRRQVAARSKELANALARLGEIQPTHARIVPGEVIANRYRVVRLLGTGGMGSVFECERTTDGRRFAVKMLQHAESGEALARLAREAQIAAQVRHENVLSVHDIDVTATGALFVVMDLVDGESLDAQRHRFGDVAWATAILAQAAAGVCALHRDGVIHRDIKPGNVLVARDGTVKVADFGIAALRADPLGKTVPFGADALQTQDGALMGTPMYMAPELAAGANGASEASDVFAFAVMAYEVLSGRVPFAAPPIFVPPSAPVRPLENLSSELASLLAAATSPAVAERPTLARLGDALSRASDPGLATA